MHKFYKLISFLCIFTINLTNASDITNLAFENLIDAVPAAYGDFNSDEFTDVFILKDNFKTIDILLASESPLLRQEKNLRCHYPELRITSIVPGDFDGDAFMDVMFTVKLGDDGHVGVYINYGESDQMNCTSNGTKPLIEMLGEPLAIDFNDDFIIDLFGSDLDGKRAVWVFSKNARGEMPTKNLLTLPVESNEVNHLGNLIYPHSHSVLDLNDDSLPDLVLSSDKGFEIWYANASLENRYQYNHTVENPTGKVHYGQAIFMDLELNGELHQLIPVCKNEDCSESTICVVSFGHCHDLNINFRQDNNNTEWGFLTPKKSHDFDHQHDFYKRIISLRVGDFNNDGYPDLLATLEKKSNSLFSFFNKESVQTFLLENIPIENPRESDKIKRTFVVRWHALAPFGENTVMGSFYDFYQDGILDVILLEKNDTHYRPMAFRNTLDYDANFVKVIVLTGLFNIRPPAKQAPFGGRKLSYGTNLPGPKIRYQTTTQEGNEQKGASTQLPQSAYFSLTLPYTCFGLGRTPNFVDYVQIELAGHTRKWEQLIPNSQMFVIPEDPVRPSKWKAQLFVTPSKLILRSVIALLGKKLNI